jgi:colanic acid biosynthesis protein WcaH
MSPFALSDTDFRTVVRLTPLVSLDLIIRDPKGRTLLGLRTNEPAKGFYFVPGGRVLKNEPLRDAFSRILKSETSYAETMDQARFVGAFDHIYHANKFGDPDFGTHYVAIAWWETSDLLSSATVHENTKGYFRQPLPHGKL